MKLSVCSSIVEPRYAFILSKTDDSLVHRVIPSTIWNDPLCDCRGYLFRGRCSHVDQVEEDKCNWWTDDLNYTGDCQYCGMSTVIFDFEPEYD